MLPPEIRQPAPPALPPMPMMMQAGQSPIPAMVDPVGMLEGKMKELEQWMADMLPLTNAVHPPLKALLVPMANIGKAFETEIAALRQRTAQPSPMMMGQEAMTPEAAGVPPAVGPQ
jgi:hypothetical protein